MQLDIHSFVFTDVMPQSIPKARLKSNHPKSQLGAQPKGESEVVKKVIRITDETRPRSGKRQSRRHPQQHALKKEIRDAVRRAQEAPRRAMTK